MPSIAALIQDKSALAIPFGDETLNIVYQPSKINAITEAKTQEIRREGRIFGAYAAMVAEWVVEWDLTDGKKAYPPTQENVEALGHEIVQHIRDSILADYLPKAMARKVGNSASG